MEKKTLKSLNELKVFAKEIADKVLAIKNNKNAIVLALAGDLGAGKTAFAQAFAKELGIKERILSPSFLIFRNYKLQATSLALPAGRYKFFYHADVYRIKDAKELEVLNFKEILKNLENVVLIEWADKIKNLIPKDAIWLKFSHGKNENERSVEFRFLTN